MKPDHGVKSGGGNTGTAFTLAWNKDFLCHLISEKEGCGVECLGRQERCHLEKADGLDSEASVLLRA